MGVHLITVRTASTVMSALIWHRWFIGLVIFHLVCAVFAAQLAGVPFSTRAIRFLIFLFTLLIPVYIIVLFGWRLVHMVRHVKTDKPLKWFADDLRQTLLDPDRMVSGAITLVAISFFFPAFSFMKDLVAVFQDFPWDQTFAAWDRALHFGTDPYVLLMPVLGGPVALKVLNGAYHFWLFLLYFVVFVAAFTKVNPHARLAFLIAFVLTWGVGGNLLAIWLSSAGPVYYDRLGFGGEFVPLMDHLNATHRSTVLWALDVQEMIWQGYLGKGNYTGISAMPSMHVASSTLLMLYVYTWKRLAGHLMAVFLLMILLGSVMLGWHYAIDGYLGALIAWAAWKTGQRLAALN
jgi:hypothetical protein